MQQITPSLLTSTLKHERDVLAAQNRTVSHALWQASQPDLLPSLRLTQRSRQVPSPQGARLDAYIWDSWDWQINGDADLRRFLDSAQRLGACLAGCCDQLDGGALSHSSPLLPGSMQDTLGTAAELHHADYWLLTVHHLAWQRRLPDQGRTQWRIGSKQDNGPYCFVSQLSTDIVKASIDALSVLIAEIHQDGQLIVTREERPASAGCETLAPVDLAREDLTCKPVSAMASIQAPRAYGKRAERAINIDALKCELVKHIRAARDHVDADIDFGRDPRLLPRPTRRQLGLRVGINESTVSRCFSDPHAPELTLLWETAGSLETVLNFTSI